MRIIYELYMIKGRKRVKRRIENKFPYKDIEMNLANLYLINLFNKFLCSLNEEKEEKKRASLEKEEE